MLKDTKPIFQDTVHDIKKRMEEWDARYRVLDIEREQEIRLKESEYKSIIDHELAYLKQKGPVKALELACGSAPWAKYLVTLGIDAHCSDYSSAIVERLKSEQKLNAFVSDIADLSNIPDDSYNMIVMAGGIYEDPDPYFVAKVYSEIHKKLCPGGVFIQFCNRFLNWSNFIQLTKNSIKRNIRNIIDPRCCNLVRYYFKKRPLKKAILFWLMSEDLVVAFGKSSGMQIKSIHYMQHEHGLCEILFLLPCIKNKIIYTEESAFIEQEKLYYKWFILLARKVRKSKNRNICKAVGLVFEKSKRTFLNKSVKTTDENRRI